MVNECLQMFIPDQYSSHYSPNYRKERSMTLSGSSSDSGNCKTQSRRSRQQTPRNYNGVTFDSYQNYQQQRSFYQRQGNVSSVLNVFNDNLTEGIKKLREYSKISSVVAVDTEFPGVVVKLHTEYVNPLDYNYMNVKLNNDLLKPIQIGFSFFDKEGNPVSNQSTLQFNFKWSDETDVGNNESIELLKRSGIDFSQLEKNGIDPELFSELFITTGLIANENITWVGFHCAHDWAYILKIVTGWQEMPDNFGEFLNILQIHFPKTLDLKTLSVKRQISRCGLQELSNMFNIERFGCQHQAGSDSRLTGDTYFKFICTYYENSIKSEWYNLIYGLNYCPLKHVNLWQPTTSPDDNFEGSSVGSARSSPYSGNATPDDETNSNNEEIILIN